MRTKPRLNGRSSAVILALAEAFIAGVVTAQEELNVLVNSQPPYDTRVVFLTHGMVCVVTDVENEVTLKPFFDLGIPQALGMGEGITTIQRLEEALAGLEPSFGITPGPRWNPEVFKCLSYYVARPDITDGWKARDVSENGVKQALKKESATDPALAEALLSILWPVAPEPKDRPVWEKRRRAAMEKVRGVLDTQAPVRREPGPSKPPAVSRESRTPLRLVLFALGLAATGFLGGVVVLKVRSARGRCGAILFDSNAERPLSLGDRMFVVTPSGRDFHLSRSVNELPKRACVLLRPLLDSWAKETRAGEARPSLLDCDSPTPGILTRISAFRLKPKRPRPTYEELQKWLCTKRSQTVGRWQCLDINEEKAPVDGGTLLGGRMTLVQAIACLATEPRPTFTGAKERAVRLVLNALNFPLEYAAFPVLESRTQETRMVWEASNVVDAPERTQVPSISEVVRGVAVGAIPTGDSESGHGVAGGASEALNVPRVQLAEQAHDIAGVLSVIPDQLQALLQEGKQLAAQVAKVQESLAILTEAGGQPARGQATRTERAPQAFPTGPSTAYPKPPDVRAIVEKAQREARGDLAQMVVKTLDEKVKEKQQEVSEWASDVSLRLQSCQESLRSAPVGMLQERLTELYAVALQIPEGQLPAFVYESLPDLKKARDSPGRIRDTTEELVRFITAQRDLIRSKSNQMIRELASSDHAPGWHSGILKFVVEFETRIRYDRDSVEAMIRELDSLRTLPQGHLHDLARRAVPALLDDMDGQLRRTHRGEKEGPPWGEESEECVTRLLAHLGMAEILPKPGDRIDTERHEIDLSQGRSTIQGPLFVTEVRNRGLMASGTLLRKAIVRVQGGTNGA